MNCPNCGQENLSQARFCAVCGSNLEVIKDYQAAVPARASMVQRMVRAAKLEPALYEEVEHDRSANRQALFVVLLAALAAGIGGITAGGVFGLIFGVITALGGWLVWSFLTLFIGTRLFPTPETEADFGQMTRTIGFAASPGVIRILGVIPFLAWIVYFVAAIWMLVAMVVAVRQALDYTSTWRAVGVVAVGWIVQAVLLVLFAVLVLG